MVTVKYSLKEGAVLPSQGSKSAGWYDLSARIVDGEDTAYRTAEDKTVIILSPGEIKAIPTGLFTEIPEGWRAKIDGRSGMALKKSVHPLGGCIDSDYRGEWKVILQNSNSRPIAIENGDRIAQFKLEQVFPIDWVLAEKEQLASSVRGETGFGASGA
jgi:dUTP pyrophosphatase